MSHITSPIDVTEGEILPLSVNVSTALAEGDTVSAVEPLVREITSRKLVEDAVLAGASVTDNVLSLTLDATKLKATNKYEIVALMTVAPGAKVIGAIIPVKVVA